MKAEEITYDKLSENMVEALPELKAAYDKEVSSGDGKRGPDILYNTVLVSSLKSLIDDPTGNASLLRNIFAFLEILANHPDERVQEVLHDAVCESICSDEPFMLKCGQFMGKTTGEYCRMIAEE